MLEGTTLTAAFLGDNWVHLSSQFPVTLNIGCDSTCTLYILKPGKQLKNVLIKNLTVKLKNLWAHLSVSYNMIINVYFIQSDLNCADLNSKISADPILVSNSKMWRSGISHFLRADFPEESRIFLSVVNGDFHWNEHNIDFNAHVQNCSYCSPDAAKMCLCVSSAPP